MADEFVARPKDEDERLQRRVKELEDREANRQAWKFFRIGLCIASIVTTGIPLFLPGDGGEGS